MNSSLRIKILIPITLRERFVDSANQHPAPESCPYYYLGGFEDYRNRRLNQLLAAKEKLSVDDMKRIQLDNFSVKAQDLLAIILPELDTTVFTQPEWKAYRMWKTGIICMTRMNQLPLC
ncbi:MAG: penicillin acylase family protein [Bacteroidia bacterium]